MPEYQQFLWGAAGSLAVELVSLATVYESVRERRLPWKYRRWGFYLFRIFLMGLGGGMAVVYEVDTKLLAMHVGAATPLILQTFAQVRPSGS